jgi:hypothetical protein
VSTERSPPLGASVLFEHVSCHGADSDTVRCFGTEDRPADVFMPPLEHPFNLVEFNVGDLNDLKFEDAIPDSTSTPLAVSIQCVL